MPSDHHLSCPFCAGDDVTPFPDPTAAWSCLDCARVFRVEVVQPASVNGWGVMRVVPPVATSVGTSVGTAVGTAVGTVTSAPAAA